MNQNKLETYSVVDLSILKSVLTDRLNETNLKIKEHHGFNPTKSKEVNEAKLKSLYSQQSEYLADITQLTVEIENRML